MLVVEDEFFLADDLQLALVRHGATIVGPVATLRHARQIARTEPIDFGILDINLQGEMVFALAEDLRALAIPYIFVTGYDPVSMPHRYRAMPRLQKPFSDSQVVDAVIASLA